MKPIDIIQDKLHVLVLLLLTSQQKSSSPAYEYGSGPNDTMPYLCYVHTCTLCSPIRYVSKFWCLGLRCWRHQTAMRGQKRRRRFCCIWRFYTPTKARPQLEHQHIETARLIHTPYKLYAQFKRHSSVRCLYFEGIAHILMVYRMYKSCSYLTYVHLYFHQFNCLYTSDIIFTTAWFVTRR